MSNCAQHHDYKGAIGYCPRCRIAELEALDKDRVAQIKGMGKYTISIEEQLAHRDAAWGGSGGMPSYTTLKAELEKYVLKESGWVAYDIRVQSELQSKDQELAALREAAQAVVSKAPGSGPLWFCSKEIKALAALLQERRNAQT